MKKGNLLFVVCFLFIISFPLVFIDRKSIVSEKENRVLATFPTLWENDRMIDIETIPQIFDNYINDRFGFRNVILSLANIFNKTARTINGNVIIGKKDWLFYSRPDDGNNINDFFKLNLFTDDEINKFIENIEKRFEWCNSNNIKFVFLIAPNKHNVYPEYYPFDRPEGITRTEQIMGALPDHLKEIVVYPLDYMVRNKAGDMPFYFETDTHWNMAGAHCAFALLFNRVKQMFPSTEFPDIKFITDISYDSFGDIVPMLGFTSYGRRTIPNVYPMDGWETFYQYIKNERLGGVIIKNRQHSLPKAIVFRDSFFDVLEPFASSIFSSAEYNRKWFNESEKNYILENKPDIIIWELVERNITDIPNSVWN
jgi:hypothetical protein